MNLVLFDVDGTLMDASGVHTGGMIQLLGEMFGIWIDGIAWGDFEHVTDTFVISELFRRHLGRNPRSEELLAYRKAYVGQLQALRDRDPESFREIPGARAALQKLEAHPDWAVSLATGGSSLAALSKLKWAGFEVDHLPGGFAEDGVTRQEIIEAAIEKALAHHQVLSFDRIVSVGDGLWDLHTARSMGLEFVAITSRGNRNELQTAGAALCFDSFTSDFHPALESGA